MQNEESVNNNRVQILWQPTEISSEGEEPVTMKPIRVAAYCRVSTELDEQTGSFELQERHYTRLICSTPGWRLAGIYADQGITGTALKQRTGFQRMIRHCQEGKIDRIICKSISRFARNTVDLLETVRTLKDAGISVIFEKEGIDTLSVESDFILSTIAAIAQDESRSISENMMWSFTKRFQRGVPVFKRILGYDVAKSLDGKLITINAEEAEVVREIFDLALQGKGVCAIARHLTAKGCKTTKGSREWGPTSVKGILNNERYTGDVLCQKTFTDHYLTHLCKRNRGEKQQYLIENHHPAIIDRQTYAAVQKLHPSRAKSNKNIPTVHPLSGRVMCGNCGAVFHRYTSAKNCCGWACSRRRKSRSLCCIRGISEKTLARAMLKAFEARYELTNKSAIHKLALDLKRLQEDYYVDHCRIALKRELAHLLRSERQAKGGDLDPIIEKRADIEQRIAANEKLCNILESDREYLNRSMAWLDGLSRGQDRHKVFLEQLSVEYMRAWVIGVTVLSPISFNVKWFDNSDTNIHIDD